MAWRDGMPLRDVPISDDALAALSMLVFLVVAVGGIAAALVVG